MNQLREKLQRFMTGRYGIDQLGQFCAYGVLVLLLLNIVIRQRLPSIILEFLTIAGMILMYLRMLSRNISKRYQENQVFLRYRFYLMEHWRKIKFRFTQGHKFRIFKCPACKQKVRIPRGHGKVSIHCPTCGADFIRKS